MQLKAGKNIRLFKNPYLEHCTYVHPAMPLVLWGPVVAVCFGIGLYRAHIGFAASLGYAAGGLLFWTLSEYLLHRFIFHFEGKSKITKRIHFLIHGIHHDDPEDARRLLMPPVAAIAIAIPFYYAFWAVLGDTANKPFFAGFIAGYLIYDYTHFAVHFAKPKSKWFKRLKHNHMQHHFVSPGKRFGVSNTFWDHVFRTHGS